MLAETRGDMTDSQDEHKARMRKKNIAGLVLGLIVFAWFLTYLITHIPD